MTESPQPCTPSPVSDAKFLHKHGAEGIENSHMARKPEDVDVATFMREHLTPRPAGEGYVVPDSQYKGDVEKISGAKVKAAIYAPVCALLNKISKRIYDTYIEAGLALDRANPVLFLDHHTGPPKAADLDMKNMPEIVGVFGTKKSMKNFCNEKTKSYMGVPYHRIITTGECKPEAEEGAGQAVSYICQHARARLDMPGTYALFANARGYRILWSDASEVVKSPFVDWTELGLLEGYIRSLYFPPKNHHLWDPTISSPVVLPDAMGSGSKVHWTITYNGSTYSDCNPFFLPLSRGRRTTVFMYEGGGGDDFAVIKDAYRDDAQRFDEATLINDIHGEGIFPGVVRVLESGDVNGEDGTAIVTARPADRDKKVVHRTKKRLIMGSRGSQFCDAKTVKDILKAAYDALEVHRALLKRRRFLHRDLSIYNVLIYPEHSKQSTEDKEFISDPPKFIDEILGQSNDCDDKCRALLIDADNSASLKSELMSDPALAKELREELAMRTGTPRYIARSAACGRVLGHVFATNFKAMPGLEDTAKDIYIRTYGNETYEEYEDAAGERHGGGASSRKAKDTPFIHRPDHDVESMFWLLVVVFLLAKPQGMPDDCTEELYGAWDYIERHTIGAPGRDDTRQPFFLYDADGWEAILHPGLSSLAPLMVKLGVQVFPEYALMDPAPPEDHLHEVFRRLILEHIVGMGDTDIDLEVGVARETKPPADGNDGKRKADDDPDRGNRQNSKRSKSHRSTQHHDPYYLSI